MIFHLALASEREGHALLDELEGVEAEEGLAVVDPDVATPKWVATRQDDVMLTPGAAKGLEYDTVVVMDPGRVTTRVAQMGTSEMPDPLESHELRMAVNSLRVAISRATHRLIFVDTTGEAEHEQASLNVLGNATPADTDELVAALSNPDQSLIERVRRRLEEARRLVDTQARRAWVRASQAWTLIETHGGRDRGQDPDLMRDTSEFPVDLLTEGAIYAKEDHSDWFKAAVRRIEPQLRGSIANRGPQPCERPSHAG